MFSFIFFIGLAQPFQKVDLAPPFQRWIKVDNIYDFNLDIICINNI